MKSISELQQLASSQLAVASPSPQEDVEQLLCHVLQKPRSYLFTWPDQQLTAEQQTTFDNCLFQRLKGKPIAYITGSRGFWQFELEVSEATLIPRPDTEILVEQVLAVADANQSLHVIDLGTGTGAIALALAYERPNWQVTGVDLLPEAVELAARNGKRLGLTNVQFFAGHWFEALPETIGQFDLVVSNPPYIPADDPHLQQGDVRFEPKSALVAEQRGLAAINEIAKNASDFLKPGGYLFFEHGYDQATAVREILAGFNYQAIQCKQDLGKNDRITFALYC
ncbi:peptide chain release factor N(5)-glutamine methyltransferase [Endozoicomonas sp. SM1973]|uniref:Release factor glutamine methyltransferase n=1 Tax=Spartinivicinus marinus TaxID=2994442 RepID=A0A853I0S9_9GAMM|nr:peptide chain release factor N(5)-glutamine methyltransferase [Spartinivicinus marinus]MCX4028105.1 peptide chain release factor N(5)-glutamine methyltransferase [Spartinivicinus marinus]NYZ66219.1 peptide chain release factor N(5)-glutamine methyltransferase [Spartinivicinus marinus]